MISKEAILPMTKRVFKYPFTQSVHRGRNGFTEPYVNKFFIHGSKDIAVSVRFRTRIGPEGALEFQYIFFFILDTLTIYFRTASTYNTSRFYTGFSLQLFRLQDWCKV